MIESIFENLHRRLKDVENKRPKLQEWQATVLLSSWANAGAGYTPTGYWKDSQGIVWLRGRITGGAAPSAAFTLPVKYRPEYTHTYATYSGAVVEVRADGTVQVVSGSTVALDQVSFRAFA